MSILWAIIIGFIVGIFAKLLTPGKNPGGFIITTLLGIGGSLLATFLGQAIGMYGVDQQAGFIMSVVGAMILLFIYDRLTRKTTNTPTL